MPRMPFPPASRALRRFQIVALLAVLLGILVFGYMFWFINSLGPMGP